MRASKQASKSKQAFCKDVVYVSKASKQASKQSSKEATIGEDTED